MRYCLLLILTTLAFCLSANARTTIDPAPRPSAKFHKIWIDYDVTENGQKGMRIHLKFTVYGMKNLDSYVAVYFEHDDEWGGFLRDKNQKFTSTTGDVALYRSLLPAYDPAEYEDLRLFMPYSELDLAAGDYDLTMLVKLIYKSGGEIAPLTSYDFTYRKPAGNSTTPATKTRDARFDKIWVDYDITEGGERGMRIHVKFKVTGMQGEDGFLAIYFETKNGEKLYTNNSAYRNKNGQILLPRSIRPAYKDTDYNDLSLFMPYKELNLPKGHHDLKIDVDITLKNGDLLKHLAYKEFYYKN